MVLAFLKYYFKLLVKSRNLKIGSVFLPAYFRTNKYFRLASPHEVKLLQPFPALFYESRIKQKTAEQVN